METATLPPNTIVPEVLEKDNYKRWSILIKHYLIAQDVWDVVEPNSTTEETNERVWIKKNALAVWIKKNALALHAIKISCGAKAFDLIKDIDSAEEAWKALRDMRKPSVYHDIAKRHKFATPLQGVEQKDLRESICNGNKRKVEQFLNARRDQREQFLNERPDQREQFLNERPDQRILKFALNVAITAGQEDIACFLYRQIELQEFGRENYGFILLEECITKKMFKIALNLLNRPGLANEPPEDCMPIILTLAKTPAPFFRGSQLKFLNLWIYNHIERSVAADDALREEQPRYQSCLQFLRALRRKPVTTLSKILAKQTYDLKSRDEYAREVVRLLCRPLPNLEHNQFVQNRAVEAIFLAIKNGIPEILFEIAEAQRDILWTSTDPEDSRTVFAYAIAHRQEEAAKFLYKLNADKFYDADEDGNNNLHLAAKLAPHFQLDCITGAALQLQSELRWFMSVEAIVPRFFNEQKNKDGETPYQVFVKEHKNLLKEAEEWMKKTAESSTVVGALIITIMFAAAYTVPGGNDQNTGFPIFFNTTAPAQSFTVTPFKVFIISDVISLCTAASSVLIFLAIHSSRYAYEDFFISLPMKLIFGHSFLFISVATMTVAFCATVYMMLRGQLEKVNTIAVPAYILILCLLRFQFPLLFKHIALTPRSNIFDGRTATIQLMGLVAINIDPTVVNVVVTTLIWLIRLIVRQLIRLIRR